MHDVTQLRLLAQARHDVTPGLVWAFRGMPGQPARPLAEGEVAAALADAEGWVWLHVDLVDQRVHEWLGSACTLPASARTILEGHDDSLSLGHEDGVVHGTAADFHSELGRESASVGRLHFAVTERLLVTGRRHTLAAAEDIREKLESGLRLDTAFDLFGAIVASFCRMASQRLAATTGLLDEVEDRIVADRLSNERRRLMGVRRLAVSLHRPVGALAALFRDDERTNWVLPPAGHAVLRRLADRLVALDREVVMVSDRAKLLQEEVATELAEESNRSLRALAIMSALLLPGTLVVGIFGMNTEGLPLTHTPGGFLVALLLVALATATFYWALLKAGANLRL